LCGSEARFFSPIQKKKKKPADFWNLDPLTKFLTTPLTKKRERAGRTRKFSIWLTFG